MDLIFVCLNGAVITNFDLDWAKRAEDAGEWYVADKDGKRLSEMNKKEEPKVEIKKETPIKKSEFKKAFKSKKK